LLTPSLRQLEADGASGALSVHASAAQTRKVLAEKV
jgi:hypothetical protein